MPNKRLVAIARVRIMAARALGIPPDDIDMEPIFDCIERAIRNDCDHDGDGDSYMVSPESKREKEAVLCDAAEKVIPMIFAMDPPFYDWVSRYEEFYLSTLVDRQDKEA